MAKVAESTAKEQRIIGRPFEKGVSGNPNGRPPGSFSLIGMLKKELQEIPQGADKTYAELLIKRILKSAITDGNDQQIKNILQYVEGVPERGIETNVQVNNFTVVRGE